MAYDDTKWGGFAKIIVDTSTLSVGDTVRVRSMTDSNAVYNKQVVTVGTPIIFETEIYKDYVKICLVQTINDTPTEVGGVYKTIDYGQTLFINVLDKTTLVGIQGILNAHNENYALNIGDEVTIKVNDGGTPKDWVMQIAGINVYHDHDIMFTSKHIWSTASFPATYFTSELVQKVHNFYSGIDDKDKQYIKQVTRKISVASSPTTYDDYCFILGNKETANAVGYGMVADQVQMPLFVTQDNRIKTYNGSAFSYYTSDYYNSSYINYVANNGSLAYSSGSGYGVVPSFMLVADS